MLPPNFCRGKETIGPLASPLGYTRPICPPEILSMKPFTICVFALAGCLLAQTPPPETQAPPATGGTGGGFGGLRQADPEPKAYDKVITKDAKSKTGIFTVHKVKSKTY